MAENSTCPRCGYELTSPAADGQSHAKFGAAGHGPEPAAGRRDGGGGRPTEAYSRTSPPDSKRSLMFRSATRRTATIPPSVVRHRPQLPAIRDRAARLRLFGEIAHGGMGTVLKGRDEDLGRDLAVKVLLEANRDDPELIRRFIEEAQIAGQLQHPGIVPVYELGTLADRRPYFTMKLVNGQTLAQLLAARNDLADGLPRLLGIFEQVCQAVAYAHTRGVIHRDLKPSNIMVGGFGEVQVMDWGLAKVLPQGGRRAGCRRREPGPDDGEYRDRRSASGSDDGPFAGRRVMGTPSYMAPEQARGEIDRIDERADVFASGVDPLRDPHRCAGVHWRLGVGDPREGCAGEMGDALARLGACAADAELVELARDCLAASPRTGRAMPAPSATG